MNPGVMCENTKINVNITLQLVDISWCSVYVCLNLLRNQTNFKLQITVETTSLMNLSVLGNKPQFVFRNNTAFWIVPKKSK